jgi:hypothetical protein
VLPTIGVSLAAQNAALRIVVIAGEDAVNIIQQKTAVAPIVEVRDRNDQPVAGAVVNFAIRGGRATFGGARTLAVTTDLAGRAVATGLTPTASGALQISASAAFQGQTAAAITIAQTNVMTAAQAAAVSGAAGSSSGGATAGAGAGAGGGGLSATTIGIIGGAVAGGAVAATQLTGASGEQRYSGPFAMDWGVGCLAEQMTGTIVIEFVASSDAPGTAISNGNLSLQNTTAVVVSRPANCAVQSNGNWGMPNAPVTGTVDDFEAHGQDRVTSLAGTPLDRNYDFRGSLTNGVVRGTLSMTWRSATPPNAQTNGTSSVTLNRAQ